MSKIKNVVIDILNEQREKELTEKYIVNLEKQIKIHKAIIKEKKNLISTLKMEAINIISEKKNICTKIIRKELKDKDFLTLNHNDNKDMK